MVTSYTILTTVNVVLGYGSHTSVLMEKGGIDLIERILVINYANFALGIMSFTTPKLAIAALLNRIMNPSRLSRVWLWILTASVFVTSTICIIVLFTMCDPPRALWKVHLMSEGAKCRSTKILVGYAIFTGGMFLDCILFANQQLNILSSVGGGRSISCSLPDCGIATTSNVDSEKIGPVCGFGVGRRVG